MKYLPYCSSARNFRFARRTPTTETARQRAQITFVLLAVCIPATLYNMKNKLRSLVNTRNIAFSIICARSSRNLMKNVS